MKSIPSLPKIKKDERLFYSPGEKEKKIYRKINKEIKRKYNINLIPRDVIIKNIISILTQGNYDTYKTLKLDTIIIRTDIKNFYPSINKHLLYQKISRSNILNKETLDILKPLFFSQSVEGVPLGLPFSSSLSEIFLEEFDQSILVRFKPAFYYRYVDDIIIIIHSNYGESKEIFEDNKREVLQDIFSEKSLKINQEKTIFTYNRISNRQHREELNFEYLGYHFKSVSGELKIDIAQEKAEKVFDKITHYFGVYRKGNKQNIDFWKLYYRLQHTIYGITSPKGTEGTTQFGIGFSYRFVNEDKQLSNILNYTKHNIFTCGLPSRKEYILFKLIEFKNTPLEVLNRRYDYRNLTLNQFKTINKRLNIELDNNSVEKIFHIIHASKYK